MFLFSKKLVNEITLCFFEEDGISLTPEQAQEYLASLAGLFLAFANEADHPTSLEEGGRLFATQDSSDRGVSNTSGTL